MAPAEQDEAVQSRCGEIEGPFSSEILFGAQVCRSLGDHTRIAACEAQDAAEDGRAVVASCSAGEEVRGIFRFERPHEPLELDGHGMRRFAGRMQGPMHRVRHEAMQVVSVEQQAVVLEHRLEQIFERLAAEIEALVTDHDHGPTLDLTGNLDGDLTPVLALAQQLGLQLRRLDTVPGTNAVDDRLSFLRRQVDRGVGEDGLIVVEHARAGKAGLVAGNQAGRGRRHGPSRRAEVGRRPTAAIWSARIADFRGHVQHYR